MQDRSKTHNEPDQEESIGNCLTGDLKQGAAQLVTGHVMSVGQQIQDRILSASETPDSLDWQKQYQEAVATLRAFGLLSGALPSCEMVQEAFNEEALKAIAQLKQPILLLVPNVSFAAKLEAIRSNSNGFVSFSPKVYEDIDRHADSERPTAFQPVVIESGEKTFAEQVISQYKSSGGRWRTLVAAFRRYQKDHPQMQGIDRDRYLMFEMHSRANGSHANKAVLSADRTMMQNEFLQSQNSPKIIPIAFNTYGTEFGFRYADHLRDTDALFRFAVAGNIIGK